MRLLPRILALLAMFSLAATVHAADLIDRIVATVNGHVILQSDWDEAARFEALVEGRPLAQITAEQRGRALDRLIDQELLREQAQGNEAAVPPVEEVQARIAEIRKQHGAEDPSAWRAELAGYGFDQKQFEARLVPDFERATGHKVTTTWGGVNAIARRVADGEIADVVMLPAPQIDDLIKRGKLVAETRVNVATSGVGVAIRAGATKIDVSSSEGIRKALLAAKTIAYSAGPSGVHMERLIARWGLIDQLKAKIVPPIPDVPIGEMVARGDAEIGFQQVSELLPVKGIDYLGPLPADIQEITVFSAAMHRAAGQTDAARALLKFLTAPEAAPIIRKTGMEPG